MQTEAMQREELAKRSSFTDSLKASALTDQSGAILPDEDGIYHIYPIQALPDFVVIAPVPVSTLSKGGVILPTQSNDDCASGIVVGKHSGYQELEIGDVIVYSKKHIMMNVRSQYLMDYDLLVIRYNNIFTKIYKANIEIIENADL